MHITCVKREAGNKPALPPQRLVRCLLFTTVLFAWEGRNLRTLFTYKPGYRPKQRMTTLRSVMSQFTARWAQFVGSITMKTPIFTVFGSVSVLLCLIPSLVSAEASTQDELQVVVTAGRKAQTVDETFAPVTVITRKQIEQSQANSVPDVLRQTTGLSLTSSGFMGKQSSVHLRGTNDSHVLVLIDGVKLGSATLGTTPLELFPLSQVERIEIVRGPRSSLYGSEALGGVIQIFTRKGSGTKGIKPQASASYGSFNTSKANLGVAGGSEQGSWFNFNAATERTDGINVRDAYLGYLPDFSRVQMFEPDKDGYRNTSVSLRAGQRFDNGSNLEANLVQAQGKSEFDGKDLDQNNNRFKQQVASGKLTLPIGDAAIVTAQLGQSLDRQDSYQDAQFKERFQTKRSSANVQADLSLGAGYLTLGLDHLKDKVSGTTAYELDSRSNTGVFANYQLAQVDFSIRRDDNEQFGNKWTGGIAYAHEFRDGLKATASYGTAFKAPTFNDLYYPYSGNKQLKPESSRNLELGIMGRLASGEWAISAFQNKIDDLIQWRDTGSGIWKPMNVAAANIRGLELQASQQWGDWRVSANATLQEPKVAGGSLDGKLLINRPKQIANLELERQWGRFSAGAAIHAEGRRYNNDTNTDPLAGFGILDVHAKYQVAKDVAISAKVANILDHDYELRKGYNQAGVSGLVTVDYQPK